MIVSTMTESEVLKELRADVEWVDGRGYNLVKKYQHRIGKVKDSIKVIAVTEYTTPRNNQVVVVWYAVKYPVVGHTFSSVVYFKYTSTNGRYQYLQLISNKRYGDKVVVYTSHAIDRLEERSGVTFREYIVQDIEGKHNANSFVSNYEYEGKTTKAMLFCDKGMFLCEDGKWGVNLVTYIDKTLQGDNQTQLYVQRSLSEPLQEENYVNNILKGAFPARSLK